MGLLRSRAATDVRELANETAVPERIWLEVPFEEKDAVKLRGARWDAQARRWWVSSDRELGELQPWLPSALVDFGSAIGPEITVNLLGLPYDCWGCRTWGVALVGMIERGGDVLSGDLVLCDTEATLRLADRFLSADVRAAWRIGSVRRRWSHTVHHAYLAQGCGGCDALWGSFPLFHEAVPEALSEEGATTFVELATVAIPESWWLEAADRY